MDICDINITFRMEGETFTDEQLELIEPLLVRLEDTIDYQCRQIVEQLEENITGLAFEVVS